MRRLRMTALCLVLLLLMQTVVTAAASDYSQTAAGRSALNYFHDVQNSDGGFPSAAGRESSVEVTCWVIMALEAAGEDTRSIQWEKGGLTPVDYLLSADEKPESTTDYSRLLLTLSAVDLGRFYQGEDLLAKLIFFQQPSGGFYQPALDEEGMINAHAWAVLAIASTGSDIPNQASARAWLTSRQNGDGGYGWFEDGESDTDDSAVVLQALILLGEDPAASDTIDGILTFIKSYQNSDGGFAASPSMGPVSNAASDAWVAQGLMAVGETPENVYWTENGKSVNDHIAGLQQDDGAYEWKEGVVSSPVKMTAYAVTALSGQPYPVNLDYDTYSTVTFTDLNQSHWAHDAVSKLAEQGVLGGYPDGTFKPDASVTRTEFTTMLIKAFGKADETYNPSLSFTDVPSDYWGHRYIALAFQNGYISGRSERIFDPYGTITGAELATIAVNTMSEAERAGMTEGPAWYSGAVALAEDKGLLYEGFEAMGQATRAECAYVIYNLMQ